MFIYLPFVREAPIITHVIPMIVVCRYVHQLVEGDGTLGHPKHCFELCQFSLYPYRPRISKAYPFGFVGVVNLVVACLGVGGPAHTVLDHVDYPIHCPLPSFVRGRRVLRHLKYFVQEVGHCVPGQGRPRMGLDLPGVCHDANVWRDPTFDRRKQDLAAPIHFIALLFSQSARSEHLTKHMHGHSYMEQV
jgi:hypothetical protein